ncbi:deaminase, partial [Bacteroides sp. AF35-22]
MGKVQILAVLTMDGCLSSELYYKAHQDLCLDRCGLDEIRK